MKNVERQGQVAAFFHGRPDLGTTEYFEFSPVGLTTTASSTPSIATWCSFTWGVRPGSHLQRARPALPQDMVDDFLRRRITRSKTVVKVWLKDPKTILIYEGRAWLSGIWPTR